MTTWPRVRAWLAVAVGVAARPDLWWTVLVQARRLAPTGWWRRAPFAPVPSAAYLRFRLETAYGAGGDPPPAREIVRFLEWCRAR